MSNPFTRIPDDGYQLNTNKFDWTHTRNLSTKLGMITPIFCEKLPEHSSISIDPKHAFQFMPFVFPVQSRIQCRISFYRMPIRAMWKDYQNWISTVNTPQHSNFVPPYVNFGRRTSSSGSIWDEDLYKHIFGTGSLADYFGMPSTYDGFKNRILQTAVGEKIALGVDDPAVGQTFVLGPGVGILQPPYEGQKFGVQLSINDKDAVGRECNINRVSLDMNFPGYNIDDILGAWLISYYPTTSNSNVITKVAPFRVETTETNGSNIFMSLVRRTEDNFTFVSGDGNRLAIILEADGLVKQSTQTLDIPITFDINTHMVYADVNGGEVSMSISPWYDSETQKGLKISSYPWRMYDAIYNTFIRYTRNNPLVINGVTEYNKVTRCYDYGGSESTGLFDVYNASGNNNLQSSILYDYFGPKFANWEFDVFTTAVQSPQQGISPLVGLTVREVTTTTGTDEQGNPIKTSSLNQYLTDETGNSYRVTLTENELGELTPTYEKVEMLQGRQVSTLYSAVSEGISIEDFRMVNAYTKYLELNQRRGYRYKDIIEGRYDVKLSYNELLMPEFIGGFTRDVEINPVTQTVQTVPSGTTYDGALGSKAGDAFCFGSSKANITCYNEEESFVMGLMSFVVEPIYTQTLPKFFLDRDVLDKWSPEFNNLGFQPITNAEVAPIQYFVNEPENLNGTFGYQRPWYQYLSKVNTAHGDFRGPLRNFLMHRVFSGAPKLNKDFTIINPNHVNDVFNVTEDTDKIFGQVKLYCSVKIGVNKDAVPRLD